MPAFLLLLLWSSLAARFDRYLERRAETDRFSGSVLVARRGEVLFKKGYGLANREHNVPNTPQTKFRIGSITKPFTAAAILQLEEKGLLSVQDPVCRYIEDCPEAWERVTLHHLLSHTSGIFNFTSDPEYPRTWMLPSRPPQTMRRFRDRPLDFQPGKQYRYSNSNYVLLAIVIEKVSGESYESYVTRNILEPAGMNDSGHDSHSAVIRNRASGYWLQGDQVSHAAFHDMSIPIGGGNLYSTVEDLFLWDQALYTDKILTAPSRKKMFRAVKGGYGYGWRIQTHLERRRISHGGSINGFTSFYARYPEDKALVVVLSNHAAAPVVEIADDLAAILFGR
jgi:CubicO group peptidase (beta-lactamase class C family)